MAAGDWKELFAAAKTGDLELVKYHIKMGVNPNYQHPEFMCTPLIESIQHQQFEVAKYLLENGADPSIKEDFGPHTPLSMAKFSKSQKMITLVEAHLAKQLLTNKHSNMKKVLVTGGNRGIGKAIAQQLLAENNEVIITARKEAEGKAVVVELKNITGNPNIQFIQGDLSSIQQCKDLVERIIEAHPDINVLINNAGVWMTEKKLNTDGLEMSFMVNYLAPLILSKGLTPILTKNKPARIVNVNAGLYVTANLTVKDAPAGDDFNSMKTYARSKLCNTMFTIDYAKELEGSGVTINAVHPGVINTGLGDSPKLMSKLVKVVKQFWKKTEYGAIAPVWLATSSELEGVNGNFYNEKKLMPYNEKALDETQRLYLQKTTEAILTGTIGSLQ